MHKWPKTDSSRVHLEQEVSPLLGQSIIHSPNLRTPARKLRCQTSVRAPEQERLGKHTSNRYFVYLFMD